MILKTVFLDRDGVINQKMPEGEYVRSAADFRLLPGVPAAIARLNRAGVRVIVVSNQRGVALGFYTTEAVDSIHANLPQPVGEQVVGPVVATIYRQLAPNYVTREIFATKRE